jgi:hypothetical protein
MAKFIVPTPLHVPFMARVVVTLIVAFPGTATVVAVTSIVGASVPPASV